MTSTDDSPDPSPVTPAMGLSVRSLLLPMARYGPEVIVQVRVLT